MNERYSRQILFREIGAEGQSKACRSPACCSSAAARWAHRTPRCWPAPASVFLRIVDRDFVEFTNLQRQTLYTEADADGASAESRRGANSSDRRINSEIVSRTDRRRRQSSRTSNR